MENDQVRSYIESVTRKERVDVLRLLEEEARAIRLKGQQVGKTSDDSHLLIAGDSGDLWEIPVDGIINVATAESQEKERTGETVVVLVRFGTKVRMTTTRMYEVGVDIVNSTQSSSSQSSRSTERTESQGCNCSKNSNERYYIPQNYYCGQKPAQCGAESKCCSRGWCCEPYNRCCIGGCCFAA